MSFRFLGCHFRGREEGVAPVSIRRIAVCLSLAGATASASCGAISSRVFQNEVAAIRLEVAERFPLGSSAELFEGWLRERPGLQLWTEERSDQAGAPCQPRTMSLRRPAYCMDVLIADYCVNNDGKLTSIQFSASGYC